MRAAPQDVLKRVWCFGSPGEYNITEPRLLDIVGIPVDGKAALFKAFDSLNNVSTKCPHFDLLGGIHHLRKGLECKVLPVHVKGHQDDTPTTNIVLRKLVIK